ncbi:spermidine synthase [Leptolinea tardivitalis]|nr:fused MFS/spermidine synthase [Leptolinea tardivitalis]GAP20166.1 spermidine synthase [Leptolinea tardivitalis]
MKKYLLFTVFISGLTSLAVEMAASRLMGNYFGSSNLVWASIIGLILIYLTVGYFIGGSWADRSPRYGTLYRILAWAGLSVAVIPAISRPVLRWAADAFDAMQLGVLFGSFVAVMILFVIPIILLGTSSPFAIRLAIQNNNEAGRISGKIYAISTLGSFIGTFIPVLLLIPTVGTYRTFLIHGAVLLVFALIGLKLEDGWKALLPLSWMPIVVIILFFTMNIGRDKNSVGMIYETESAYNYIQVLEQDGFHMLRLNDGQGVHSMYHPTIYNYAGPWEQVLVAPFFNPAPVEVAGINSMAIVGLAAGTTARQAIKVYPNISIDGFEIDPEIVKVGNTYFGMNLPQLHVFVQDGRWGLAHSGRKYQVISVDAYRPPYIPWHLTTREFFQTVHDHLTEDGVMVINIGRAPDDRRLINSLASTIRTDFASIHVMDLPGTFNSILFASVKPTNAENLAANFDQLLASGNTDPLLLETMNVTLGNLQKDPPEAQVFTDDLAPVEGLTNNMILKFLLAGDVEMLQ